MDEVLRLACLYAYIYLSVCLSVCESVLSHISKTHVQISVYLRVKIGNRRQQLSARQGLLWYGTLPEGNPSKTVTNNGIRPLS